MEESNAPTVFDDRKHARQIAGMSFRQARTVYRIGYATWKRIRSGDYDAFRPWKGGRSTNPAVIEKILKSVKGEPHLNTAVRARQLGLRPATVQAILAREGLSRLVPRLQFAGYQVDTVKPLAVARKRRLLATAPGCFTQVDFKTFGMVGGGGKSAAVPIRGCVCVDHFTGWGTVRLADAAGGDAAASGLRKHLKATPFRVKGIVLSDNGAAFLSEEFIAAVGKAECIHRTTRYNHPWSNGKVEALNKTLKVQCFPAICSGFVTDLAELQRLVDAWMVYYNTKRMHHGWHNKGLPPAAMYEAWRKAPGGRSDKLVKLGLVREEDLRYIRLMGSAITGTRALSAGAVDKRGTPYVLVIDRNEPPPDAPRSTFRPYHRDGSKNVMLAR